MNCSNKSSKESLDSILLEWRKDVTYLLRAVCLGKYDEQNRRIPTKEYDANYKFGQKRSPYKKQHRISKKQLNEIVNRHYNKSVAL